MSSALDCIGFCLYEYSASETKLLRKNQLLNCFFHSTDTSLLKIIIIPLNQAIPHSNKSIKTSTQGIGFISKLSSYHHPITVATEINPPEARTTFPPHHGNKFVGVPLYFTYVTSCWRISRAAIPVGLPLTGRGGCGSPNLWSHGQPTFV